MLKQFRCLILDAVRRKSERAMQGFLLGLFWNIPGYDPASCVRDLASLGAEYISASGEAAARMIRPEDTDPEIVRRGIGLWEQALRMTTGKEALRGFGWWVEVPTLGPDEWERLTLETCQKAQGNLDWASAVAETGPRLDLHLSDRIANPHTTWFGDHQEDRLGLQNSDRPCQLKALESAI